MRSAGSRPSPHIRGSCGFRLWHRHSLLRWFVPVETDSSGILAEIVDHRRFTDAEKLTSYAGLVSKHHNSGDTVRMGGITKRGSVWLRNAMMEAAFVAIRYDARIGAIYQRLAVRIGPMKARVAVARRVLEWVWEMLNSGTEYRTKDSGLVKRKFQSTKRIAESQV